MRGGLQSNDAIAESAVEDRPITEATYSPDLTSTLASTLVKWELSKYKTFKSKFKLQSMKIIVLNGYNWYWL